MCKVFCSLITLRKEEPSIVSIIYHWKEEIAKKQSQMKKKKVLFHQDNVLRHKSIETMAKLHKLLLHPPYSPDLAP